MASPPANQRAPDRHIGGRDERMTTGERSASSPDLFMSSADLSRSSDETPFRSSVACAAFFVNLDVSMYRERTLSKRYLRLRQAGRPRGFRPGLTRAIVRTNAQSRAAERVDRPDYRGNVPFRLSPSWRSTRAR